jgi:hypothetical protein
LLANTLWLRTNPTRSARPCGLERVLDADAAVVLCVVEVFGKDHGETRRAGGFQNQTNVRALIIGQGMALTIVGLVVGLAASLLAAPVLQSMLVALPSNDVVTFVSVTGLLIVIAIAACYVPARRATRIDPIATLRAE